ncbi:MAG: Uncharacterised protein [Cyanobium sp. ARS6]|nr:MAG: Uncharacterised protein [Cyanobium sp. ARS6]
MQADHRLTGQHQPDIVNGEAEQERELSRSLALLHDHSRGDPPSQLRGFQAHKRSDTRELQRKREFMGQGFLSLLLKNAHQPTLFAQSPAPFFVVLKVFPRHIASRPLQLPELQTQLLEDLLLLYQVKAGQVAPETAFHQLARLGQIMALQKVENHPIAGGELAHQRIWRTRCQLTGFTNPFEAALHSDHIPLGVKSASACATCHLQKFTGHQGAMTTLCAFRQCSNHCGARRHVDSCRQCLGGEHHLHQPLLEQLLDQLLPGRKHSGMMRGDSTQQSIGVQAVANGFRIGGRVGP